MSFDWTCWTELHAVIVAVAPVLFPFRNVKIHVVELMNAGIWVFYFKQR